MELKRIGRKELSRQLRMMLNRMGIKDAKVRIARPGGGMDAVVKVIEEDGGLYMCPFVPDDKILGLAPVFGSDVHEFGAAELADRLDGENVEDLWIQWPDGSPDTVPGKMIGVGIGDDYTAIIFPVHREIDAINDEVHELCSEKCVSARRGLKCHECDGILSCKVIEEATEVVMKRRRDSEGVDENGKD